MIGFRKFMLPALLVLLLTDASPAGSLADRSKDVAERSEAKKKKAAPPKDQDAAHSAFGSGTYPSSGGDESFLSSFWGWLVMAPFQYRHDDPAASMSDEGEEWSDGGTSIYPKHDLGQATAPYIRADYNYQWADNVEANDGRIELGYKLIAFHGRMTRYTDETGDYLDLRQYYAVLRYGGYRPDFLPGTFEFAVGLGMVHHSGSALRTAGIEDDTSGAITFPIKYHPFDWFGVEFRPAWYRWDEIAIGDYDLSASLGSRFVQLRGGYRWLWDDGVVDIQSGPYAGVSVSF